MKNIQDPTRRDLLKAGLSAMGLMAIIQKSKPVQASQISTSAIEPILSMQDIANVYGIGGDLIIEHIPSGSQFIYDGNWKFDDNINMLNNSINNINRASMKELENGNTGESLISQNSSFAGSAIQSITDPNDVSTTSYSYIGDMAGGMPLRLPEGASLYGNLSVRATDVPTGETGYYKPRLWLQRDGNASVKFIDELEVSVTDTNAHTSGFIEITSFDPTSWEVLHGGRLYGKVTGGTLRSFAFEHFAILFEWRVN